MWPKSSPESESDVAGEAVTSLDFLYYSKIQLLVQIKNKIEEPKQRIQTSI